MYFVIYIYINTTKKDNTLTPDNVSEEYWSKIELNSKEAP